MRHLSLGALLDLGSFLKEGEHDDADCHLLEPRSAEICQAGTGGWEGGDPHHDDAEICRRGVALAMDEDARGHNRDHLARLDNYLPTTELLRGRSDLTGMKIYLERV